MPHFLKITDNLYQGSYPESLERGIDYDIIINVSDSPCGSLEFQSPCFYKKPQLIWIPINEWSVFGYEVFYAAKKIFDANRDKKILIFCHAGACRSVLIT